MQYSVYPSADRFPTVSSVPELFYACATVTGSSHIGSKSDSQEETSLTQALGTMLLR